MATRANKRALMVSTKIAPPPVIEGEVLPPQDVTTTTDVDTNPPQDVGSIPGETPVMGDNSAAQRDVAEEKQAAHNHLALVLRDWAETEVKVEYLRQQAAYDVMRHHASLVASNTDDVPIASLATMALPGPKTANGRPTVNNVYSSYLTRIVNEFAGPYMAHRDCKTQDQLEAQAYRGLVNTRLDRALRLAVNLAWWKLDVTAFDTERFDPVTKAPLSSAWKVPPRAFIPPGYQCGQLSFETVIVNNEPKPVERAFAYLEADTKGKSYYAHTEKNAPEPITLSLDQFNAVTLKHIELEVEGATTNQGAAPQKEMRKRAARQTGTTEAPKAGETETANGETEAASAATPEAKRETLIAELNRLLFAVTKVLNNDDIGVVKRADLSDGAWQGAEDVAMIHHRIKRLEMPHVDTGVVPGKSPKAA